ncbi:DUF6843 domain-containing protein [Guptibacillus spartinae]|uniref:DUF6843 domain-containing protein n=1 Tax=Guptibacillus spartinae TaxID=3025679 RepID=UPI00235E08A2|nr:hypothetical protein [Pseudalkalibacillus spartinae]
MSMKTKLLSALFSTLFLTTACLIDGLTYSGGELGTEEDIGYIVIILIFTGFGNLVYGIPVSLLSDWISNKIPAFRFIIAAFIHISLALATYIFIEDLSFFAVIVAALFFAIEEWQHRKRRKFNLKLLLGNSLFILVLLVGLWGFTQLDLEEKTNRQYLIPEGYEGAILVRYNMAGEPDLEKVDGQKVIQISKNGYYGEARTSSHEPHGLLEDTYYYVNSEGEQTEIDQSCVYRSQFGNYQLDGEKEIEYETLQVTKNNCGEVFVLKGSELYEQQEEQILSDLFY